ncbi:MAG: flagellar basal body rod protein FlgF [Gammaproteobacteria bacterium]|nr:flagellar basal body rod protein FlgF [Gammaproteobacteria bacterium]MDH4310673.1 flagellar basal body rod protein FlgF [Gammaproteobacteria bacterium]MDH5272372.1 flagellar basal body rod protein FlgF [Gammaproteobacteria bacterium]
MDKLLYVAMSGAKQAFATQAVINHNVANAATTGFRADLHAMASRPIWGAGYPTRVNPLLVGGEWDRGGGAQQTTGRDLDVAIRGEGFIAVQSRDGTEAYTRAGDLQIDAEGQLITASGHPVLGQQGPIVIPANTRIEIGGDGTLSIVAQGQGPETVSAIDRIKLVRPDADQLSKGVDGLLRLPDGQVADADAGVQLASGTIEASNVNIAEAMIDMILVARHYEAQVRMMDMANENAGATQRLVAPAG